MTITRKALLTAALLGSCMWTAQAQTKWNLPAAYSNTNFHTINLTDFAAEVKTATGGKLDITVHGNASLFKAPEIKRAVATGQAQMGEILLSLHENEDPLFGLDVVPFLATSYPQAKKLWDVSKKAITDKLASQGLMVLMAVPWPPQGIYAKQDINSIADMKGIKWRSYNVGTARIGEIVGAQAVTIQAAELPQALATGVVTSFISSGATGVDTKVWESLTHFYDTQAWIPKNITFVNKAAFDALDKDTQATVMKLAATYEEKGWKRSEELAGGFLKTLAEKGMKVQPPSAELATGFQKVGAQLTDDWLKKAGDSGKAVIEAYKK